MFFEISKKSNDSFTQTYPLSIGLYLNIDSGWKRFMSNGQSVTIKGYADRHVIDQDFVDAIVADPTPRIKGNFLAIIDNGVQVSVTHDLYRGTPLTLNNHEFKLTNLIDQGERIWADNTITINSDLSVTNKWHAINGELDTTIRSKDDILEEIHNLLKEKFYNFLINNQLPVKVFLSGGLDTMLVYSYLKSSGFDHELVDYEHIDYTKFYSKHKHILDQYWGYRQIHNWKEPSVLITGACGDEFMLRTPSHMTLLLMYWGLSLDDILKPEHHQYKYLTQESYLKKYKKQREDLNWIEASGDYKKVCEIILNLNRDDNQHWHLDDTITFTPLKDLELSKLMMQLPKEDLIGQIVNGDITRELIARNDPDLLQYLSTQKNTNTQENLWELYSKN